MRMIDADKLEDALIERGIPVIVKGKSTSAWGVPIVDAELIRHGHWVEENTRTHSMQFKCSVCDRIAYYPQNHHSTEPKRCGYAYCPNCGAKMDEVKE